MLFSIREMLDIWDKDDDNTLICGKGRHKAKATTTH